MTNRKRKFHQKSNGYAQPLPQKRMHPNANRARTNDGPRAKKPKINPPNESLKKISVHEGKLNLSDFRVKHMLNLNAFKKEVIFVGEFKGYQSQAIVILEKKISVQWPLLQMEFFNDTIFTKKVLINDVYGDYECFPKDSNGWKMRIIHPATQQHLDKYAGAKEKLYLVDETAEIYERITKTYVESEAFSIQWIKDILDQKAEQDQIIYKDDDVEKGFVILPDLKSNRSLEKIDLIVISRKTIKSLRDLNETHLPLLKNIKDAVILMMKEKYNLSPSQFKMSVHYLPTYYHFHVHVSNQMLKNQGEHLLSTIINNIEMLPHYYQRSELSFFIKQNHPLCKKYQENGIIVKQDEEEEESEN